MKPQTPKEWALYRAGAACRIGMDILNGKTPPPDGSSVTQYALYNLLHAVEDIAEAMKESK